MTAADDEVIAQVKALGYEVTPRRLKTLRRHRLIASAQGPGAGRGKGRPSEHYPPGTAQRVAAIRRIQTTEKRVRLVEMPVRLFLDGSDSDLGRAKTLTMERHRRIAANYPNLGEHDDDQIGEALLEFMLNALKTDEVRALRKLVGTATGRGQDFSDFVESLLWSSVGHQPMSDAKRVVAALAPPGRPDLAKALQEALADNNFHDFGARMRAVDTNGLLWARDRRLKLLALCELCLDPDDLLVPQESAFLLRNLKTLLTRDPFRDMMNVVQIAYRRSVIEPMFQSLNQVFTWSLRRQGLY